jgi:hypothetical protein
MESEKLDRPEGRAPVYRSFVLTVLGAIAAALFYFGVDQRDTNRSNTYFIGEQAKTIGTQADVLKALSGKLDTAFDKIGEANSTVVEKLNQIQRQIDKLDGRVNALEQKK